MPDLVADISLPLMRVVEHLETVGYTKGQVVERALTEFAIRNNLGHMLVGAPAQIAAPAAPKGRPRLDQTPKAAQPTAPPLTATIADTSSIRGGVRITLRWPTGEVSKIILNCDIEGNPWPVLARKLSIGGIERLSDFVGQTVCIERSELGWSLADRPEGDIEADLKALEESA